ncbi:MAG: MoaD/ThiS family protein [Bacillota bacterium]
MPTYEVRAFGKLQFLFEERSWPQPMYYNSEESITAEQLRQELNINAEDVEVAFINRAIKPLKTELKDGDRVSFVPPGVPSIHRFNLGFYEAKEQDS